MASDQPFGANLIPGSNGGFVHAPDGTEGDINSLRRYNAMTELGSTGLQRTGNWRAQVEFDWQPQLRSPVEALKAFREIANNETMAFSALNAIDLLLRQVEWRVEEYQPKRTRQNAQTNTTTTPGQNKASYEDQAAFVEECIHDLDRPWSSVISEALTMLPYGFSLLEMTFKRRKGDNERKPSQGSNYSDGQVGWAKFSPRAQWTLWSWVYDADGDLVAARQLAAPSYQERVIPVSKCLHFKTRSTLDSPYGVSVLRGAWIPAFYLKRYREVEGIGITRDLTGMPIAYVPPELLSANATGADIATRQAIQNMVQNVQRDTHEGLLFPLDYDEDGKERFRFELMASGGTRQAFINDVITRYEQRIVTSMLADFLMLGQGEGSGGSYALSSDKTTLFQTALSVYLTVIADELNAKALPKLYKLNGWDPSERCKLVPGPVAKQDAALLAGFLSQLAASGAPLWPNYELYKHTLKVADLPEPSEETEAAAVEAADVQRKQTLQMAGLNEDGTPMTPEDHALAQGQFPQPDPETQFQMDQEAADADLERKVTETKELGRAQAETDAEFAPKPDKTAGPPAGKPDGGRSAAKKPAADGSAKPKVAVELEINPKVKKK